MSDNQHPPAPKGTKRPDRWVRIYRVIAGALDDTDGPISLEFVQRCATNGQATQYLHSKDCFTRYLKDTGQETAEFVIVSDHQHYQIKPIRLYVSQPLSAPEEGKQLGKVVS